MKAKRGEIEVHVNWICPHCDFANRALLKVNRYLHVAESTQRCDSEEGGCDTLVVIDPTFTYSVKVYKIEHHHRNHSPQEAYNEPANHVE